MKKLINLLRSPRGETLVEALASILIFTLSSILLFSMLVSASNINRSCRSADEERQSQLNTAEQEPGAEVSRVELSISCPDLSAGGCTTSVSIQVSRKAPGALYAFYRARSAE